MRYLSYQPEPWQIFEVTTRCIQGRFLLVPGPEANRRLVGVLARAQELFGEHVHLHMVAGTSNHLHLLLAARDSAWRARFKDHVKTNLSKELGELHGWHEHLFGRRARDIPVLDDAALLGRVRYFLAHGVKEGLVARAEEWPGPPWARALSEGARLDGTWYRRTDLYKLVRNWTRRNVENRGERPVISDVADEKTLELVPLPIWAHLTPDERRAKYRALLDEIALEERPMAGPNAVPPLGAEAVLTQSPHRQPVAMKRSPAPPVHTASGALRREWLAAYAAFLEAWRSAMAAVAAGARAWSFPPGGIVPPRMMALAASAHVVAT